MDDQNLKDWVPPFKAKEEPQETRPGCWNTLKVGVYHEGEKIGEFDRNYHSFGETTFAPFQREDGNWFALYSPNYTSIEVMSLPDCKPVGGEERKSTGFCPVEIWVPAYQESLRKAYTREECLAKRIPKANWNWVMQDEIRREYDQDCWDPTQPIKYESLALVTGCVWGDDWSWKLELRDLSQAHEGKLGTVQNWGYYPLWGNLKDSVRLYSDTSLGGLPRKYLRVEFAKITTKTVKWDRETLKPMIPEKS